jgi:hypothetical protein
MAEPWAAGTRLFARPRRRGQVITLQGPSELAATLRFKSFPQVAIETTTAGTWHVDEPARNERDGGAPVRTDDGTNVAEIAYTRRGPARHKLLLSGGEQVTFEAKAVFMSRRYRLGDDLLVAWPNWCRPMREFTAELSAELAVRADRVFLVALASVLTHWSISSMVYPPSYIPYKGR